MTFPSCRDPEKIHFYLPGLFASTKTNTLKHSQGPAGYTRPVILQCCTCYLSPNVFHLPFKNSVEIETP